MKKINLDNVVWKEGKHYVAWNINTSVASFGANKKEALANLAEAVGLYLEDAPKSKINKVERLNLAPLQLKCLNQSI